MAQFLKKVARDLGEDVEFDHWSPRLGQPSYEMGMAEALELVGGDNKAAREIVNGYAPLHALPKDVRDEGAAAIAKWAIETGDRELRKLVDFDVLFDGLEDAND